VTTRALEPMPTFVAEDPVPIWQASAERQPTRPAPKPPAMSRPTPTSPSSQDTPHAPVSADASRHVTQATYLA